MLPAGLVAQPADRADHALLRARHPPAQTVARLVVGACSCDLVRLRHPDPREDERHHRERHRRAGTARPDVIAALERHRRGAATSAPPGGWPRAVAKFVAEHARNAGPTLYLLRYAPGAGVTVTLAPWPDGEIQRRSAAEVVRDPDGWLTEETAVLVHG
jgi:hypothetical protein